MKRRSRAIILAWCAVVLAARVAASADARPAAPAHVAVSAATSLTSAFRAIASEFEKSHPGVTVDLNFAGSPTLVMQIQEGLHADVFASADEANMKKLVDAKLTGEEPRIFARNRLTIVVQSGNPKKIETLADLSKPGLAITLAGPDVPAGRYAREAFTKAGAPVPEASQEVDVKAVLQKVALGEADAGIVYVTDATSAAVLAVPIADAFNVVAQYPIVMLKDAPDRELAKAFVSFVLAPSGQQILSKFGFVTP